MEKDWLRLDNAALIFPPISGRKAPNTFCLGVLLREKINKDILKKSLNEVLNSEDTFKVRLKKGFFWYYLEHNDKEAEIFDDDPDFMEYIDLRYGNNYLFKVFAGENTIKIVFFHALTDGTGGLYFLKQVLYRYFHNLGHKIDTEGLVKPIEFPTSKDEVDDKFLQIKSNKDEKKIAESRALKLVGRQFKTFGTGIILASADMAKVKSLAKDHGTTVTGYLCAVYIQSLYEAYIKNKRTKTKTVCVSVPVNIRKKHPTETKRNFTLVVRISHDFKNPITFDELVKSCDKQLKEKLTTEQIDAQIRFNTGAEKNPLIRIVPRFIKNLLLKIAYHIRCTREETTNFSNLGKIEMPKAMADKIEEIYFILQASNITQKNFSAIGFDDKLYLAFSRRHVETKAEKVFFEHMSKCGVEFVIKSNYQEMRK